MKRIYVETEVGLVFGFDMQQFRGRRVPLYYTMLKNEIITTLVPENFMLIDLRNLPVYYHIKLSGFYYKKVNPL